MAHGILLLGVNGSGKLMLGRELAYVLDFFEIENALIDNGFIVEKMIETIPTGETIKRLPHYEKDWDKPNFLLIKAHK